MRVLESPYLSATSIPAYSSSAAGNRGASPLLQSVHESAMTHRSLEPVSSTSGVSADPTCTRTLYVLCARCERDWRREAWVAGAHAHIEEVAEADGGMRTRSLG